MSVSKWFYTSGAESDNASFINNAAIRHQKNIKI